MPNETELTPNDETPSIEASLSALLLFASALALILAAVYALVTAV